MPYVTHCNWVWKPGRAAHFRAVFPSIARCLVALSLPVLTDVLYLANTWGLTSQCGVFTGPRALPLGTNSSLLVQDGFAAVCSPLLSPGCAITGSTFSLTLHAEVQLEKRFVCSPELFIFKFTLGGDRDEVRTGTYILHLQYSAGSYRENVLEWVWKRTHSALKPQSYPVLWLIPPKQHQQSCPVGCWG